MCSLAEEDSVIMRSRTKSQAEKSFHDEISKSGVNTLNQNLVFDHKLTEKINVQKGSEDKYNFQKKWLSKVKNFVLVVYYFVIPFV